MIADRADPSALCRRGRLLCRPAAKASALRMMAGRHRFSNTAQGENIGIVAATGCNNRLHLHLSVQSLQGLLDQFVV